MFLTSTFFFSFKIFFLFTRVTGRDIDRGKSRLPMGSLIWDSISGPWDLNLSQRQINVQPLSHPGAPYMYILIWPYEYKLFLMSV